MKKLLIIFILFHSFIYSNTKSIDKQDKEKIHKEIKAVLEKAFLLSTTQPKSKALKTYLLKHLPKDMHWNDSHMTKKEYVDKMIWFGEGVHERLQKSNIKIEKTKCKYIDNVSIDCRVTDHTLYLERYEDSPELSRSTNSMGYLINFQLDDKAQWYIHGFRVYAFGIPKETSSILEKQDMQEQLSPAVPEFMDNLPLPTLAVPPKIKKKLPKKIYKYNHAPKAFIDREEENASFLSEQRYGYSNYGKTYSHNRARHYALRYALHYNGRYRRFNNDCSNFVSQSLYAGGWRDDNGWYKRYDVWFYGYWHRSYTWAGARNLTAYLVNYQRSMGNTNMTNLRGLRVGDVIAFGHKVGGRIVPYHMMMVTTTGRYLPRSHPSSVGMHI